MSPADGQFDIGWGCRNSPGEVLALALASNNVTQKQLAEKIGVSTKHISQVVNNKAAISLLLAIAVESVLGVAAEELVIHQALWSLAQLRIRLAGTS